MSHVPKRALQHGLFLPGYEVAPPALKPGQLQLGRQLYGEEARPLSETYLNLDRPVKSVYARSMAEFVQPDHYTDPVKPIRPSEPSEEGTYRGTAHWRSEYRSTLNEASVEGARYHRQDGPSYQATNPPTCVGGAGDVSSYTLDYGRYGSNPRDRIGPDDNRLPVSKNALTAGTVKGTDHIPGYQGFMPSCLHNPDVARVAQGSQMRSVDKTRIQDSFHANLLGYSGFEPTSAQNAYATGRQPSNLTVTGRDFVAHPIGRV